MRTNIRHTSIIGKLLCLTLLLCLPLAANAVDTFYINTQSDFETLASKYSGKEVNVILNCDLTFTKKGYAMYDFRGTFDGRGHKFKFNYIDEGKPSAPFEYVKGTIKNLYLTGNIQYRYGYAAYTRATALARMNYKTLTVENCHCDVNFKEMSVHNVYGMNSSKIGGFLSIVDSDSKVTFKDCSFTGSFRKNSNTDEYWYDTAGFIGMSKSGSLTTFINCFSYLDFQQTTPGMKSRRSGYFAGWSGNEYVKMTNCYAYSNQSDLNNYGSATVVSQASLKSGEVAYKLAAGRTGSNNPWGQQLGIDNLPRLKAYSTGSADVFYTTASTRNATEDEWTTLFYPANVTLPAGVEKYVVTSVNNDARKVRVNELSSANTANVPLLLHSNKGFGTITLPATYYNKEEQSGKLRGTYTETTYQSGDYVIDADYDCFVPATANHKAWRCYLAGGTGDEMSIGHSGTDIVVISSKSDWSTFKTAYTGDTVTVYLNCDLIINEGEASMKRFIGTLHGQGHTITLNYTSTAKNSAVFNKAEGTIDNLRIVGSVPKGNCTMAVSTSNNLTFKDCYSTVGFIGTAKNTVTFESCLSDVTTGQNWFVKHVEPDGGRVVNSTSFVYGNNNGSDRYDAAEVTTEQLASGEVTYKLNNGRKDNQAAWVQTLSADSKPLLKTASPDSKMVYYASGDTRAKSANKWSSLYYPAEVKLPKGTIQYTESAVVDSIVYVQGNLNDVVPAYQPTLLYAEDGMPELELPAFYYNDLSDEQEGNIVGTAQRTTTSGELRVLTGQANEAGTFGIASSAYVRAYQCYLNLDEYDTYYIELFGLNINSKEDWDIFREKYNGKRTTARLYTDLTLTEDDCMEHFVGTFYGMDNTITIDFDNNDNDIKSSYAPFKTAEGTIQALNLTGNIRMEGGSCYSSPLVYKVADGKELNIHGCTNNVRFTFPDNQPSLTGYVDNVGGYVNTVGSSANDAAKLNIHDCSFTGAIISPVEPLKNAGGFVANVVSEQAGAVTIQNCYSDLVASRITSLYDETTADYFAHGNSQAVSIVNSYARPVYTTGTQAALANVGQATLTTSEQLHSGEIAYRLQAAHADEDNDDVYWVQTIGTDTVPLCATLDNLLTGLEVHQVSAQDYEFDEEGWGTLFYPVAVPLPAGVKAYTVGNVEKQTHDGVTENYVVLHTLQGDSVPAATPVVLRVMPKDDGTLPQVDIHLEAAYYNILEDGVYLDSTANCLLYGSYEDIVNTSFTFVLDKVNDSTAFYYVDSEEEDAPVLSANKCLLLWEPEEGEEVTKVNIVYKEDGPDGIVTVIRPITEDDKIYDLQGRQVRILQKGNIYIKNGVKFIARSTR